MKKFIFSLCIIFAAVSCFLCSSAHAAPEVQTIKVSNAREFLEALGSNKIIEMAPGKYNLSEWDPYLTNRPDMPKLAEGVSWSEVFDGGELILSHVGGLTIKGVDPFSEPNIVVDPRYAFVMKFENCYDLDFEGLYVGHTEGGECMGGVFGFEYASRINMDRVNMYGSGTQALELSEVFEMRVVNSSIYGCTYHIMTVSGGDEIVLASSHFYDNQQFSLINVDQTANMVIENCRFTGNLGQMFNARGTVVTVSDSIFSGNTDTGVEDSDNVKFINCAFESMPPVTSKGVSKEPLILRIN